MMGRGKLRLAIVDDNPAVFETVRQILSTTHSSVSCVACCQSPAKALQQLPALRPDVILMDIRMPSMSGIDCTSQLLALRPDLNVLMFSGHLTHELVRSSLSAGAIGYLEKSTPPAECLAALEKAARGVSVLSDLATGAAINLIRRGGGADFSSV